MEIWSDWIALALAIGIWSGYSNFARIRAKSTHCVASALHRQRHEWIDRMLLRENRVADVSVLRGVEQSVIFFASSALLVIGALLTVLVGDADSLNTLSTASLNYWLSSPQELKLIVVLMVFVRAFFHLTWGVRQYSFFSVVLGSAPSVDEALAMGPKLRHELAGEMAYIADRAGHAFNFGLRAWYFALSFVAWVISPWAMVASAFVVAGILYRREFRSKSLSAMLITLETLEASQKLSQTKTLPD